MRKGFFVRGERIDAVFFSLLIFDFYSYLTHQHAPIHSLRSSTLHRWNLQQAIFVDIALIFPGLLSGIARAGLPAIGVTLPAAFMETFDDATFVALLGVLGYCVVSSLLGREPGGIPFVSKAVGDRMPTIDMFDDEGRFIPRQMREKEGDDEGGDNDKDEKK